MDYASVVIWVLGIVVCLIVLKKMVAIVLKKALMEKPRVYKDDVIYLHMFPREMTKGVVNLSPYAIKLECWFRLNKVPYEVVETIKFSKATKQIPYVIYNGVEYCESNLIIEHFSKVFEVENPCALDSSQLAVSRAFTTMLDDHTAWTYFLPRYSFNPERFAQVFRPSSPWPLNVMITKGLKKSVMKRASMHGIGRHSPEVLDQMGQNDIRALSHFLGGNKFMFGERMTTLDCCLFGHLSQIVFVDFPYAHKEIMTGECANIVTYMNRIKAELWPDWDDILSNIRYKF